MNILCIGDVVGESGCSYLLKRLPNLKKELKIDLCIVNGENSAEGNGILPASADEIFAAGADVITGGNHTLRRREIYESLDENEFLLRPYNLPKTTPGKGVAVVDLGYTQVAVVNLIGTVYMESNDSPFFAADDVINELKKQNINNIIVDLHAEATSEKRAMGFYIDGRVTALFGTHTHVQTADAQLLPNGTAYITDIGMTGTVQSVLGVRSDVVISKMRDKLPARFVNACGDCKMCGCLISVDRSTGKAKAIRAIGV